MTAELDLSVTVEETNDPERPYSAHASAFEGEQRGRNGVVGSDVTPEDAAAGVIRRVVEREVAERGLFKTPTERFLDALAPHLGDCDDHPSVYRLFALTYGVDVAEAFNRWLVSEGTPWH